MMRLQKFLARAGVASRRSSEALIASGRVCVNGSVVTELGTKVDPACDVVEVDGARVLLPADDVTIMLNKPAGYLTSMTDPQGRPCVASLVPLDEYPSLYPVGRLDFDTTGLLLFTTNGELGHALLHPSKHVNKTYVAKITGQLSADELRQLEGGITLDDGPTKPARVRVLKGGVAKARGAKAGHSPQNAEGHAPTMRAPKTSKAGTSTVEITISEGRKRQVKRMFLAVGHRVLKLHRSSIGQLQLGGLPEGKWRVLTDAEVKSLQM